MERPRDLPALLEHPVWFFRSIVDGATRMDPWQLFCCLDWLIDARPKPDSNQQRAGWSWMLATARAYKSNGPWSVPLGGMTFGSWRVVPILTLAELEAEGKAMNNCLKDYERRCRSNRRESNAPVHDPWLEALAGIVATRANEAASPGARP